MLEYIEITPHRYIIYEGAPHEVLSSHVFRKQQRKPVNSTKLRNLLTGGVTEVSFHQAEKVEEALIHSREIRYLYGHRGKLWFSELTEPSKRFSLRRESVGLKADFLKPNSSVQLLTWNDKIVGFKLPIKVDLMVIEAPPALKGDTAKGGTKQVKLETGSVISAPLFVSEGDIVRVNTETGEYSERVS